MYTSNFDNATLCYQDAAQIFFHSGDAFLEAVCRVGHADILAATGHPQEAVRQYLPRLQTLHEGHNLADEALVLLKLAHSKLVVDPVSADTACTDIILALSIYRGVVPRLGVPLGLKTLGDFFLQSRDHSTATACFKAAFTASVGTKSLKNAADCMKALGELNGRTQVSVKMYGKARELYRQCYFQAGAKACEELLNISTDLSS